jgi:microsomal prostaglandin-E synthase 2
MLTSAASLLRVSAASRGLSRRALATVAAAADDVVRLYQYAICPFCNKTKAVMDYAQVPYEAVEVNPLTKAELKW